MRRITLQEHIPLADIEEHYKKAQDAVSVKQWQTIWLIGRGKTVSEVVDVTGYTPGWVRAVIRAYNKHGVSAVGDKRKENPGAKMILSAQQKEELSRLLEKEPPDGGLWTSAKVAKWIEAQTGRKVHPQRGWEYLKRLGCSLRVVRPTHAERDETAQAEFQKKTERDG